MEQIKTVVVVHQVVIERLLAKYILFACISFSFPVIPLSFHFFKSSQIYLYIIQTYHFVFMSFFILSLYFFISFSSHYRFHSGSFIRFTVLFMSHVILNFVHDIFMFNPHLHVSFICVHFHIHVCCHCQLVLLLSNSSHSTGLISCRFDVHSMSFVFPFLLEFLQTFFHNCTVFHSFFLSVSVLQSNVPLFSFLCPFSLPSIHAYIQTHVLHD